MILRHLHIVILLLIGHISIGQVTLSIDSTKMLIGDQRTLTLQLKLSPDAKWVNNDIELSDTLTQIQTIRSLEPVIEKSATHQLIKKQWIIAPFDTGLIYLPAIIAVYNENGQVQTRKSNNIPIYVRGVTADSTGLAPIKMIFEEKGHWIDYLELIIGFILLALLGVGYYFWKNRKIPEPEIIVIERPAHELAIDALDQLEREQLWQRGEIKTYHTKLTHVFREYLEKRFDIKALESTTMEIRQQLRGVDLEKEKQQKSVELLQLSDLVKFAKAEPRVEVHAELMQYVRKFIFDTKVIMPIISQNDEEE